MISFSIFFTIDGIFLYIKLAQYNEYSISIVAADALVLLHQGISSYSAEDAPPRFQLFMG